MALTDENGSSPFTMPVQPMYGGGYGNGGFGGFGAMRRSAKFKIDQSKGRVGEIRLFLF